MRERNLLKKYKFSVTSWKGLVADRKTKAAEGNADVERLATTQGMKEAKHLAASLNIAENRLSKECNRYQKCTVRLRKAGKKL